MFSGETFVVNIRDPRISGQIRDLIRQQRGGIREGQSLEEDDIHILSTDSLSDFDAASRFAEEGHFVLGNH